MILEGVALPIVAAFGILGEQNGDGDDGADDDDDDDGDAITVMVVMLLLALILKIYNIIIAYECHQHSTLYIQNDKHHSILHKGNEWQSSKKPFRIVC